jgi:hypothetical protein
VDGDDVPLPIGAQCAVAGATVAEQFAGAASPEVLAGMLGAIRQTRDDPRRGPKTARGPEAGWRRLAKRASLLQACMVGDS